MPEIIYTRGLPGAGKTTWAKKLEKENPQKYVRINRDKTRVELFGSDNQDYYLCDAETLKTKEQKISEHNDEKTVKHIQAGKTVILDDTNLNPEILERIKKLARTLNVNCTQKDFTNIPLETCLKQNAQRKDKQPIPEKVVREMYKRFI